MAENEIVNMGFKVTMHHSSGEKIIFRNVTEIHYNYNHQHSGLDLTGGPRIVFNTDIHGTGFTYRFSEVLEFEAELETEIAAEA